jgi:uncharacterized membrane protein
LKKQRYDDRTRLAMMATVSAAVIVTAMLWIVPVALQGMIVEASAMLIIALVLATIAIWQLRRVRDSVKSGLPIEDERSKRVKEKAGYYALLASIWFILGFSWFHSFMVEEFGWPALITRHAFSLSIGIMAAFFMVFWAYQSRKSD